MLEPLSYYSFLIQQNKDSKQPVLNLNHSIQETYHNRLFKVHKLLQLPKKLGLLSHLEELWLCNHDLVELDEKLLQQLPKLKRIVLHGNPLETLPNLFGLDIDWCTYENCKSSIDNKNIVGINAAVQPEESWELTKLNNSYEPEELSKWLEAFFDLLIKKDFAHLSYLRFNNYELGLKQLPNSIGLLKNLKGLDLAYNQLGDLPDSFAELQLLETLQLQYNFFSTVPEVLAKLPKLQHLGFQRNILKELPSNIETLKSLESLDLSYCGLEKLPDSMAKLSNLRQLNLQGFSLSYNPKNIFDSNQGAKMGFKGLKDQFIFQQIDRNQVMPDSDNQADKGGQKSDSKSFLENIWETLWLLPQLEDLNLSFNEIGSLPELPPNATSLKKLDLNNASINQLPDSLANLDKLEFLDLSEAMLEELPEAIFQLKQLRQLCLFKCFWSNSSTPAPLFHQLQALEELYLGENQLPRDAFLNSILQLPKLTLLDLSQNQLQSLPDEIGQLTALKYLFAQANQLTQLPESITKLQKLSILSLDQNQLIELPQDIGQLENLEELLLYNSELQELPTSFCELESLKILQLESNKLSELPGLFYKLSNLKYLNLKDNFLNKISKNLAYLENIAFLDLSSCGLRKIPKELFQMPNLKELSINNNNLISPPIEIAYRGIEEILAYFEELEKQKSNFLQEAKMLIVGSPGAGKTTLRLKLFDANSPMPRAEDSTEGVDVEPLLFALPDGQQFRMNIWDFGGQELYHSTHQFFFTHRSLYVLVLNTRRDDDRIDYWLHTIQLFGGNSPVLVIQNQEKDRTYPLNEQRYRSQFPNIVEFVKLNLSSAQDIPKLLNKVKYLIQNLPHIGDELPNNWMEIRSHLLQKAKTTAYISWNEFKAICNDFEINSSDKQQLLANYLHDLGAILYFEDNAVLKNTLFLRSNWVIDAAYRVLDNKIVKDEKRGKFHWDDLEEIWNNPEYLSVKSELLELMLRFELCFKIPGKEEYIVPQMLAPTPPLFRFKDNNLLKIRFQYEFMPRGLLTRFMVQMNHYIQDFGLVWKEGVIIERLGVQAMVTENYDKHCIEITLCGERKKEFFAIISDELEHLHQNYPQELVLQKLIPCNCSKCSSEPNEPFLYDYEKLQGYLANHRNTVVCDLSFKDILVAPLLDGINNPLLQAKGDQIEIIFLAANPKDTQSIDLVHEKELLQDTLSKGEYRNRFRLENYFELSFDKLQEVLVRRHPPIVHFSGHGSVAGILLEDKDKFAKIVDAESLVRLFKPIKNEVFCVILNACYSAEQAKVIAQHIRFVVGMNNEISDSAAQDFAQGFYLGLSNRMDIEHAFETAMQRVAFSSKQQIDRFELWKDGQLLHLNE